MQHARVLVLGCHDRWQGPNPQRAIKVERLAVFLHDQGVQPERDGSARQQVGAAAPLALFDREPEVGGILGVAEELVVTEESGPVECGKRAFASSPDTATLKI